MATEINGIPVPEGTDTISAEALQAMVTALTAQFIESRTSGSSSDSFQQAAISAGQNIHNTGAGVLDEHIAANIASLSTGNYTYNIGGWVFGITLYKYSSTLYAGLITPMDSPFYVSKFSYKPSTGYTFTRLR